MAWVVDRGIIRLFEQINAAAPGRSKASDGTIGDAAHQASVSDHNPEHPAPAGNPDNQVDAGDYTHDPAHGADMGVVSESIRVSRDPRVSYVIFNRRIFSGPDGPSPYVWRAYTGTADPHTNHMHVSVRDATHDQSQDWQIGIDMPTVKEIWNTDGIINNRPFRPDFPTNPTVQPETALVEIWDDSHQGLTVAQQTMAAVKELAVAVAALTAKVDALAAGPVAPGTTFNATVTGSA